jgi:endonuclease-3
MDNRIIDKVFRILEKEIVRWQVPVVGRISKTDPFKILITTILSLRTKDKTTEQASMRLFKLATDPEKMERLALSVIEKAIYPVGFYHSKARNVKEVCRILLDEYKGKVPDSIDELLNLPGVGRKTANLVVTLGFDKPGICVDTHVHRITNRWGYVRTKDPFETEMRLRQILPKKYWKRINDLLVTYGQNLCVPISPHCSQCKLYSYCDRVGVGRYR